MSQVLCIAYREDGGICGEPAMVLDLQRGGMVCDLHAPQGGERPQELKGKNTSGSDEGQERYGRY